MTRITTAGGGAGHPGRMTRTKGYTIEMIESAGGKSAPFAPSFGVFTSLLAAKKAAALRIALSAPRLRAVGYRILDQDKVQVSRWPVETKAG